MPRSSPSLGAQLAVATVGRVFLNTARRFPYPFAADLARGSGFPLVWITAAIAASQATALLGPVFGPLGDRWGYRRLMLLGLALLAVGFLAAGALPGYPSLLIGILLAALGKTVFDPAVQAYVGSRVPLERRGFAIGWIETAWSGSTLVGIPVVGLVIGALGWRAPFWALAALAGLWLWALARVLPRDDAPRHASRRTLPSWRALWHQPGARAALGFGLLMSAANDSVFVAYGAWLEASFGFGVAAVGAATIAIGAAELSGESLTALLSDRLGLARATAVGLGLSTLGYAVLPLAGGSIPAALGSLFAAFVAYEFTIVTSFSLCTEIAPEARASLLSGYMAVLGLGRMIGALAGGVLWQWGGMPAVALSAAAVNAAALAAILRGFPAARRL